MTEQWILILMTHVNSWLEISLGIRTCNTLSFKPLCVSPQTIKPAYYSTMLAKGAPGFAKLLVYRISISCPGLNNLFKTIMQT